jgi:hypothetical protein
MSLMDNYIFDLDDNVTRRSVSYKSRFGITISADLYRPKDFDESEEHPAIIVGAPYGGVKEQGPGIYAQNMALRGFVALTFDPSFNGYSGGEPRHLSSPDIFVEDFSAAVDYLGTRPFVDRERIGVIGMCGSGALSLSAAQVDRRIKAVAPVVMYDHHRLYAEGFENVLTEEQRIAFIDQPVAMGRPQERLKQAKTVAAGCDRLPETFHGKEGVDGSSPSEGSAKAPHVGDPAERALGREAAPLPKRAERDRPPLEPRPGHPALRRRE